MGWSCAFLLVRDGDQAEVAARLGGRLGTEALTVEQATTSEAPGPAAGPLINGWLVVTDKDLQLVDDDVVARLSEGGHVLEFFIEERVSFTSAASWRNGAKEWSLTYNEGKLTATGEVPEMPDDQGDEFDAPADLIYHLTDWWYGDELENEPFLPIVRLPVPDSKTQRRRWWAPWRS